MLGIVNEVVTRQLNCYDKFIENSGGKKKWLHPVTINLDKNAEKLVVNE